MRILLASARAVGLYVALLLACAVQIHAQPAITASTGDPTVVGVGRAMFPMTEAEYRAAADARRDDDRFVPLSRWPADLSDSARFGFDRPTVSVRQNGEPVYYGQADRPEMLERVGADRAAVMLLTMDDPPAAGRAVQIARRRWPELRSVVRARDAEHAALLQNLGADAVVPDTFEASLQIAGHVLRGVGIRPDAVDGCLNAIRDEAYSEVRQAAATSTQP